ncbi:hypothetical protein DDE82_008531 [Stemphylium lycopersici]|nr:hypothetical protein DDE82_008531 [Stemphylium lycopersici]
MAAMFRDFSFDPASPPAYADYEAERAAMNVSPTSTATESTAQQLNRPPTPPPPPCTMGDLAVQLNQQTLRIDTSCISYPSGPLTPGSDNEEGASPTDTTQQERPTYSRIAASVLRMQRQQNARMQCNSSHVRDISKLVKMIEEEKQCTVSESSSRTCSTSSASTCSSSGPSGDDEGVDMDYDIPAQGIETLVATPVWRATDRRETCIRVTKPVRMRKRSKESGVGKRRSS